MHAVEGQSLALRLILLVESTNRQMKISINSHGKGTVLTLVVQSLALIPWTSIPSPVNYNQLTEIKYVKI